MEKGRKIVVSILAMMFFVVITSIGAYAHDGNMGKILGVSSGDVVSDKASGETLAATIVSKADSYVGKLQYVSGGKSLSSGVDCSGFVCAIYELYGYDLWGYRTTLKSLPSSIATNVGTNIGNALPGDIIVYSGHVGIYAGSNLLINAANPEQDVVKKNYSYYGSVVAIMRVNGVVQNLSDTAGPTISNISVSDIDNTGYTVSCTVTDTSGVARVQFPSWTWYYDQDDIQDNWMINASASGTTTDSVNYSYRVNVSEHNYEGGWYFTAIYAYDIYGNESSASSENDGKVYVDRTAPVISDIQISNISKSGYTISCSVTDDYSGINFVQFPTWTDYKGQDDCKWENHCNPETNFYSYEIKSEDHNGEVLGYNTMIIAYDKQGNKATVDNKPGSLLGNKVDLGTDFVAVIKNVNTNTCVTNNDGNAVGWQDRRADEQKWKFVRCDDGSYQVITQKGEGGEVLAYLDYEKAPCNELNIGVSAWRGMDNQKWNLYKSESDTYFFFPSNSSFHVMTLDGGSSADGTNVKLYEYYNGKVETWRIEKIDNTSAKDESENDEQDSPNQPNEPDEPNVPKNPTTPSAPSTSSDSSDIKPVPPAVGTIMNYKGLRYKVMKNGSGAYMQCIGPVSKDITNATIYGSLKITNKTGSFNYPITQIKTSAFKNCKKLKKIQIGSQVKTIGKYAFYNCKKLKSITIKSKQISKINKNAFKGIHKNARIKVPASKRSKYKKMIRKAGAKSTVKFK